MEEERKKIAVVDTGAKRKVYKGRLIEVDDLGPGPPLPWRPSSASLWACIKIPLSGQGLAGPTFSLTTTGGTLLTALVFGHFGHFGPVNVMPSKPVLQHLRELGLMFFLTGAGVAGGAQFVEYFKPVYFLSIRISIDPGAHDRGLSGGQVPAEDQPAEQSRVHYRRHDLHPRAGHSDPCGGHRGTWPPPMRRPIPSPCWQSSW